MSYVGYTASCINYGLDMSCESCNDKQSSQCPSYESIDSRLSEGSSTDTVMIYSEWVPILEKENSVQVLDDDGGRELARLGKLGNMLTKNDAYSYFRMCTIESSLRTNGGKV